MKITSLVENTKSREELGAEHGLSLYIETGEKRLLFDMGQTDMFEQNAKLLGLDLSKVDLAILSHGHYDHGGGLKRFLEINKTAPVYLSSYAFGEHFHGTFKYIGLNQELKKEKRLFFINSTLKIAEGITVYPRLEKEKKYLPDSGLMRKEGDKFQEEDFRHEQYLLVEEGEKRVLFSGCSHGGILELAEKFSPDYLIGGFHFSKLPIDNRLEEYTNLLGKLPVQYYTCHCTGKQQYDFMKEKMRNLFYLAGGDVLEIRSDY